MRSYVCVRGGGRACVYVCVCVARVVGGLRARARVVRVLPRGVRARMAATTASAAPALNSSIACSTPLLKLRMLFKLACAMTGQVRLLRRQFTWAGKHPRAYNAAACSHACLHARVLGRAQRFFS